MYKDITKEEVTKILAMNTSGYDTVRIASHLLGLRFSPLWHRIHTDVCKVILKREKKNGNVG